jgi:superfamily I DNA/RNA helicase
MRHRISQMLPGIQLNDMWLGTFHGLGKISCFFLIRKKFILFSQSFLTYALQNGQS